MSRELTLARDTAEERQDQQVVKRCDAEQEDRPSALEHWTTADSATPPEVGPADASGHKAIRRQKGGPRHGRSRRQPAAGAPFASPFDRFC